MGAAVPGNAGSWRYLSAGSQLSRSIGHLLYLFYPPFFAIFALRELHGWIIADQFQASISSSPPTFYLV
ncbi:hypothetical protein VTH06DRAFT_1363 [Thermothelomyces fergusii]